MLDKIIISSEKLKDVNWIYAWFDSTIDKICSNLSTINNEYTNNDPIKKILVENQDILDFKIKQTYNTLMKLHVLTIETPVSFYKKYHGPFKKEIGKGPFEEVKRDVTYTLESFLTQLKSLIDISIKFGFVLATINNSTNIPMVDSLGLLDNAYKKNGRVRNVWSIIKPSRYFSDYIDNRKSLFEVQNYRDVIVHEGYIRLRISASINEGEVFFRYKIPKVGKRKRRRTISETEFFDIIQFTREKFFLVLSIISKFSNKLFTKEIKQKHLKELLKYPHNDVAEILRITSIKGKLGEDYFRNKEELDEYLVANKIHPSELIEYKKSIHEYKSKFDSSIDTTEYVDYVPMENFEVYKVKMKHEMDGKIVLDSESYHLRKHTTTYETFKKISNYEKIIEHLKGCTLIYVLDVDEKRYGPLENDLKELIYHMLSLNQEKWTIQLDVHKYEKYLPEVEEAFKKIHGKKYVKVGKKHDEDFERELGWYEQWKKDPYADYGPQIIVDQNDKELKKILPHDYLDESKVKFVNWRKNILIRHDTGRSERLTPTGPGLTEWIEEFIKICGKRWKQKPHNHTDVSIKRLKKHKKEYELQIENTKKDFKKILKKYSKLKPILQLINADIYLDKINYNSKHPGLYSSMI